MDPTVKSRAIIAVAVTLAALSGAWITVNAQFAFISKSYGENYIEKEDFGRHQARVELRAVEPYRFRVLSPFLKEAFLRISPFEFEKNYTYNSFLFRVLQNIAIFLMAYIYYRSFDLRPGSSIVGLALLAYAMNFAFWQSDLSCHTYNQLLFLLVAGWLVNNKSPLAEILLLPLVLIAALNREETVFIPVMLLAARASSNWPRLLTKRTGVIAIASIGVFFAIYFGVRYFVGSASYSSGRYGLLPGMANLYANLTNHRSWLGLALMYSLLPLSIIFWGNWPTTLRRYLVWVGIPWFVCQFVFGAADETRLFLGPVALIFIPAALIVIDPTKKKTTADI